jgi:hypothetical protein
LFYFLIKEFLLVSCKKNETKIFGPDPTGPAGPGPTNRVGLVRFGSIPTDPPSPLSLLGSSPLTHMLLSAPLVAAALPISSAASGPLRRRRGGSPARLKVIYGPALIDLILAASPARPRPQKS